MVLKSKSLYRYRLSLRLTHLTYDSIADCMKLLVGKKLRERNLLIVFNLEENSRLEMLKFKKDSPLKHHFQYQQFKVTLQLCVKNLLASDWTSSLWCWAGIRKSQTLLNSCQKVRNKHLNPAIENALCMLEASLAKLREKLVVYPVRSHYCGSSHAHRNPVASTKMSQRPPSARRKSTLSTECFWQKTKKHSLLKAKCDDACTPHSIPFPFPWPK